ncbi:MAG: class I SAM-dependent RNA methyltransferase, partial [Ruminococcus sp.]|nr:class I SAM-dependent RNA methyltransferase [Ruminococcus sp.]
IAPGLNRSFAAERWSCVPAGVFEQEQARAREKIDRSASFRAEGYDIDPAALEIAANNAEKAGVGDRITFARRDIRDFVLPEGYCTVIVNPPYGERLLDLQTAEALYRVMGERFPRAAGKRYTVITPDDDFEKLFGRKADKRRKTYNGMLKCQIYQFY